MHGNAWHGPSALTEMAQLSNMSTFTHLAFMFVASNESSFGGHELEALEGFILLPACTSLTKRSVSPPHHKRQAMLSDMPTKDIQISFPQTQLQTSEL
jgi:hypothetical protein